MNYQIIIISNQSGIARGYFTLFDYEKLTKWMLDQFSKKNISILDVFFCPHGPKSKCSCRKPKPGMLVDAQNKYHIDIEKSWMIGDKETDITGANSAGINNTILVKSGHKINEKETNAKFVLESIDSSKNIIKI